MSRLSYLEFINGRFEHADKEYKIVIWYSDDPRVNIAEEIAKNKKYCDENKIFVLPLDNYSETQLISEIQKINSKYVQEIIVQDNDNKNDNQSDIVNDVVPWIVGIIFLLFFFEWRIK